MRFTEAEKLRAAEQEAHRRRRGYAVLVEQGMMSQAHYEREIAVMEAIAEDYRARVSPLLEGAAR